MLLAADIDVWCGRQAVPLGDHVEVGIVAEGAAGPPRSFMVHNRGHQNLTLGTVSVPEGFRVTEGLAATIRPGRSDKFTIELKTDEPGFLSGVVRFDNNDPDEGPYEFTIAGEVAEATSGLRPRSALPIPRRPAGQSGLDGRFRDGAEVMDAASLRKFRMLDYGTEDLHLGSLQVPDGFRLIDRLAPTIRPGRSDDFVLLMKTTVGLKSGLVRFTSDAPDADTFEFTVRGEVARPRKPEVDVLLGNEPVGSGALVDFGTAQPGDPARERTFTVVNHGIRTLTLGLLVVPDGFRLVEGLRSTLRPGVGISSPSSCPRTNRDSNPASSGSPATIRMRPPTSSRSRASLGGRSWRNRCAKSVSTVDRTTKTCRTGARSPSAVQRRRRDFLSTTTAKATSTWVTSTCRQALVTACRPDCDHDPHE